MEPWGTPASILTQGEAFPFIETSENIQDLI